MVRKDDQGRRILVGYIPPYPREVAELLADERPDLAAPFFVLAEKWDRWDEADRARLAQKTPKKERPMCGARCRDGHSCQARVVDGRRRCRMHGGLSTGPRTEEGRRRIAESNRARGDKGGCAGGGE